MNLLRPPFRNYSEKVSIYRRVLNSVRRKPSDEPEKVSEYEESLDKEEALLAEVEAEKKTEALLVSANKSKLSASHRRILRGKHPFVGVVYPFEPKHKSKEFRMSMLGKYGEATGINPGICWPTPNELEDREEYERVFYDEKDLPTIIRLQKETAEREEIEAREREEKIEENIKNMENQLNQWKNKIKQKNQQMEAERLRKVAILKDLRKEFGYDVDPNMPHYAQKIAEKEKEYLKREKEEKKAAKAERKQKFASQ